MIHFGHGEIIRFQTILFRPLPQIFPQPLNPFHNLKARFIFGGAAHNFLFFSIQHAFKIYAALRAAAEKSQELAPEALKAWVTAEVERNPLLKVIYYQSVDARTMQEVAAWSDAERIQGCIAVQAGDIRLIDNIRIR